MAVWVMAQSDGSWTVRQGRVRESFDSQDEALRFVRRWMRRGDRLVMEEADGYRTPIRARRRGWRRP
jgi:hypothetical protein